MEVFALGVGWGFIAAQALFCARTAPQTNAPDPDEFRLIAPAKRPTVLARLWTAIKGRLA